nr:EOG090X083V [Eulimnadia texana]
MAGNVKVKVKKSQKDAEELQSLSKEELIARVHQLEAHVSQLKAILEKGKDEETSSKKQSRNRQFDYTRFAKRHVLLHIAYLGWDYQGFVVQEQTQQTIEAELFKALKKTCLVDNRETSNYHRCGRTDKGVSAFGQVISIDLRSNLASGKGVFIPDGHTVSQRAKEEEIQYAAILNKVLPHEIRVIGWAPAEPGFSARFDCKERVYRYFFPRGNLDIKVMQEATRLLIGQNDFRNFCKMDVGNGVVNYVRSISEISIRPLDSFDSGYSLHELTISGQAFLWHQVRCIVAVLFMVGQGKEKPEVITELLDIEKNPRKPQYSMASELPLNLFECRYDDVEWIHDAESLKFVVSEFQAIWTENSIKATMLRAVLENLERTTELKFGMKINSQAKTLMQGVEPKTYQPLLQRQKCQSLEHRIEHYAKRRRIEVVTEDSTRSNEK